MGGSCFAKGNNNTLKVIKEFVRKNNLDCSIKLVGSLCQGRCKQGPNITIDGKSYERVDPANIIDILNSHLEQQAENFKNHSAA